MREAGADRATATTAYQPASTDKDEKRNEQGNGQGRLARQ